MIQDVRRRRDEGEARATLARLAELAATDANLVEPLVDCARALCTEGEIVETLKGVFGGYAETPRLLSRRHDPVCCDLLQVADRLGARRRTDGPRRRRVPKRTLLALLLSVLAVSACSGEAGPEDGPGAGGSDELRVVTTVSPITNIVQNIAGRPCVDVTGIVPEGTNSHTFEPAPSDARAMADADVVFINGLHLEEPTRELAEANVGEGVEIVELGALTIGPDEYIFDFSFPEQAGDPNPHLWTNPPYAKRYAEIVRDSSPSSTPRTPPPTRRTSRRSPPGSTSSTRWSER